MAVRNLRAIKPKIWIPPVYTTIWKVTVERLNGVIDDITDLFTYVEIEDGVTESIGRFEFEMWNPNETYNGVWSGMEIFRYYSDYSTDATTLRFRGRLEKVSYTGNKIKVNGRGEALKLMDVTVTKSYADTACSTILSELVTAYGAGFTTTNIETSATTLTVNWYQKPFWECIQELSIAANFDCYVDCNLVFNFFSAGSRLNNTDAIVHDMNLMEVNDFANDTSLIKNRIIIYGAEQEGTQIIYTAEDGASQTSYGTREEIISDGNITSYTQAQELGDYYLNKYKNPPNVGNVKGFLLATIQPGEKILISSPADNIIPNHYEQSSYTHRIDNSSGEYYTKVNISKEPRKISHVIKTIIENAGKGKNTTINPNEMRYSYNFTFDSDNGSHDSTEIIKGVLKLSSGSSGTWISPSRTLITSLNQVYAIINGETLTSVILYVSGDDGDNWEEVNPKTLTTISLSKGKYLKVKVVISNADTQIESLSILYSVD